MVANTFAAAERHLLDKLYAHLNGIAAAREREKLEQYQRVAVGELKLKPNINSDDFDRVFYPVEIPYHDMCERVLEWNL